MPLTTHSTPYGLRDVKLTAYTDTLGTVLAVTSVDLPVSQTLSFSDTESFNELRGDDQVYTTKGTGSKVEWELESGGIPLDAYKIMAGGTISETGTTPAQKKTFTKKGADARPWFRIEGQVISESGGDLHCVIYRAKATGELSGEFGDGQFYIQSASGEAYPMPSGTHIDKIYDFVQNETITAFVQPT